MSIYNTLLGYGGGAATPSNITVVLRGAGGGLGGPDTSYRGEAGGGSTISFTLALQPGDIITGGGGSGGSDGGGGTNTQNNNYGEGYSVGGYYFRGGLGGASGGVGTSGQGGGGGGASVIAVNGVIQAVAGGGGGGGGSGNSNDAAGQDAQNNNAGNAGVIGTGTNGSNRGGSTDGAGGGGGGGGWNAGSGGGLKPNYDSGGYGGMIGASMYSGTKVSGASFTLGVAGSANRNLGGLCNITFPTSYSNWKWTTPDGTILTSADYGSTTKAGAGNITISGSDYTLKLGAYGRGTSTPHTLIFK